MSDLTDDEAQLEAIGGNHGAGIGGGFFGAGGAITIENNPTVIATKGMMAPAEIGNGFNPNGTTTLKDSSENNMYYIRTEIKDSNTNQSIPKATVTIDSDADYKTNNDGITGYFVTGPHDYQISANGYATSSGKAGAIGVQSNRKRYTLLENIPPMLNTTTVNAKTLALTYSEDLDDTSIPEAKDFEVIANDSANLTVTLVAVSSNTVTLTLENDIKNTDIITISYTRGTQPIQDKASNDGDSFQNVLVTNTTSFMKRIGKAMEENGYEIEYMHCSSDPNSLDGVVIPAIKVALLDGTSPHVVDPKNPGAVDEIIHPLWMFGMNKCLRGGI